MSYRTDLDHFVRKYEKKHGVRLSGEQLKYEYFKKQRTENAVFSGICGAVFLVLELWLILFCERFDYYPAVWVIVGLLVLLNLWWVFSGLKDIREYPEKHSAPKERKTLTRAVLAEQCRDLRGSVKFIAGCLVVLCVCAAAYFVLPEGPEAAFNAAEWTLGSLAVLFAVISLLNLPREARWGRQILHGDFLFVSSYAQDIVTESDGDSTEYYVQFSTELPAGKHGKPGYYSKLCSIDNELEKRYYLVLFRDKDEAKKGIERYDLRLALPADEWEPDDDLRQILREY